jgi:cobalamin biosynthesis protein CbiG
MCNLKLNNNQVKKQADDFCVVDDLSSDDDWITKGEKHSNFDLLGAIDSATRRKNDKEDESDEEEIPNDVEMKSHGTQDNLEIQIDDNLENLRSFELNNIDNIGVGTSSDTNNPLDDNDIDECLRNNE